MTTVIATRTMMVSDSKCSVGNVSFETTKLFQVGASLLGVAGGLTAALKFIEWFKTQDPNEPPILDPDEDSFDVLEVSPEGMFIWDKDLTRIEIHSPFFAIGSGCMAALAALHLGTSPEKAIEIASLVDSSTSGPLQVLHLSSSPHNGNPARNNPKGRSRSPKAGSRTPKK